MRTRRARGGATTSRVLRSVPHLRLDAFDFDLPRERIAQHPLQPRDAARLLVVPASPEAAFRDLAVGDLPDLLEPGDLLVVNDTKVIPARLHGTRGAASIEVTLIEGRGDLRWSALAKPARKCRPGDRLAFGPGFAADVVTRGEAGEVILDFGSATLPLAVGLERYGAMPLPPYIQRPRTGDPADRTDYQTRFARAPGAIAAPTAGLHFTDRLMAALAKRGVGHVALTLHVGAGTFLPVKGEDTRDHVMHTERFDIGAPTAAAIAGTRAAGRRIVAVGTTVLRALETAVDDAGAVIPGPGETRLFIQPGHRFRVVDQLMTNFHLPRSTLFMLVAAFSGLERMQAAYAHAIARHYRFYSYGDACLLERAGEGGG